MAKEICMPKLGMSMTKGEVTKWLVKEGDMVNTGDDIVEILNNKASHTVAALDSGILEKIVVDAGESATVGAVLAVLSE